MKKYASLILALSLAPSLVNGSGSYSIRPPRPPSPIGVTKDTDRERYELGKKIYSGKAHLTAEPSADIKTQQETRLRSLQARLPESAQKKTDLPALAGRLTPAEMDALEYYVNKRFPSK